MSPLQTRPSPGRQIVLVGFPAHDGAGGPVPRALSAALAQEGLARADLGVYRSLDSPQCQGYLLPAPDRRSVTDEAYWRLREALAAGLPSADVARLVALMEIEGASVSAVPTHHYVVETDVVETAEADLNDWYDQEHMPGLAAVEGTVRAARYRNLDGGGRYHACYELASRETLGSPAWLRVRATPWSARVRPMFTNTRRTMFRSATPPKAN